MTPLAHDFALVTPEGAVAECGALFEWGATPVVWPIPDRCVQCAAISRARMKELTVQSRAFDYLRCEDCGERFVLDPPGPPPSKSTRHVRRSRTSVVADLAEHTQKLHDRPPFHAERIPVVSPLVCAS